MGKRVCPKCGAVEDEDTYRRYQARIEAVERDLRIAKDDRRTALEQANLLHDEIVKRDAKLAAVREECDDADEKAGRVVTGRIRAILDGEGE